MTSIIRIIKFALQGFFRNFWLSLVTITMMLMAVLSVTLMLTMDYVKTATIKGVEQKIDILISLQPGVRVERVDQFVADLENLAEVKKTSIITPEQNREMFSNSSLNTKAKKALEVFGADENPFSYSVAIQAYNIEQYPVITKFIDQEKYQSLVEEKSFNDYQTFIDKINDLSRNVNKYSWYIIAIFIFISAIVIFNTIRISIYSRKDEIMIMKLVGATDWFVKAPFLLEGVFYALAAVLIMLAVIYPLASFIQPLLNNYFQSNQVIDIQGYFQDNFWLIFGGEWLALAILNMFSTSIAIRKYLKV
ncbi:MAG: hypothetical protein C3F02_01085 [Parcubacteria group bacterium]|nr:MAG: hypothetical protein C3F02_01085 [Parcubacteria group bacterium]